MTPALLAQVMEATWPPARTQHLGPWTIRDGAGGGKRVSAATADGIWTEADLAQAEAAMRAQGMRPLFLIREGGGESAGRAEGAAGGRGGGVGGGERGGIGERAGIGGVASACGGAGAGSGGGAGNGAALDTALAARGYHIIDPVVAYACAAGGLAQPPGMTTFAHWPPLAIARDLWAEGGIGPARLAVMDRVTGPKCAILARQADRPAGVAFVAVSAGVAMLHALEITPARRRQGSAQHIVQAAAGWALTQGAATLSLVVTVANQPARALYASLGMQAVGHYHYRQL